GEQLLHEHCVDTLRVVDGEPGLARVGREAFTWTALGAEQRVRACVVLRIAQAPDPRGQQRYRVGALGQRHARRAATGSGRAVAAPRAVAVACCGARAAAAVRRRVRRGAVGSARVASGWAAIAGVVALTDPA